MLGIWKRAMRHERYGCCLIALLLVATVASAKSRHSSEGPEALGFSTSGLSHMEAWFEQQIDAGALSGAVILISRFGKVAYYKAIGYQDRGNKVPMRLDSIFRIASMTKPITTTAAMILAEEGRLELSAPVSKYLQEFKDVPVGVEETDPNTGEVMLKTVPQRRPMTVQDLMRHTAGFVYPLHGGGQEKIKQLYIERDPLDMSRTSAEAMATLAKIPLAHQPGEVFEYGMAVDVLGRVVEVVSGMSLDQFIEQRIAKPLEMVDTAFYVPAEKLGRVAQPLSSIVSDPITHQLVHMDVAQKPAFISGGGGRGSLGGLMSTAADYHHFCEMILHHGARGEVRILAPAVVELMTSDALPPNIVFSPAVTERMADTAPTPDMGQSWGLGFNVRTASGRNPLPGHIGMIYWSGAVGTTFFIDPAEQLIAILMIQTAAESASYRRAFRYLVYGALRDSAASKKARQIP